MSKLPHYLEVAEPNPRDNRSTWYTTTAPTYAGVMLWFPFWAFIVAGIAGAGAGGGLAAGIGMAIVAVVIGAILCHVLTYIVPGMLGMKTGFPLYVVGTSTFGAKGGFIMPGFLMGALQFGWLSVNGFFAAMVICKSLRIGLVDPGNPASDVAIPGIVHGSITTLFIVAAVLVGLFGIKYVGRVSTYVPIVLLVVLVLLFSLTCGGLSNFDTDTYVNQIAAAKAAAGDDVTSTLSFSPALLVLGGIVTYILGFFATAGAAGVDFGSNARGKVDVGLGGLVGIVLATSFSGIMAVLIVAGAYGQGTLEPSFIGKLNPVELMDSEALLGANARWAHLALGLASFAPACFPALIAANSFRSTMPKFWKIGVLVGVLGAVGLSVSGLAGEAAAFFGIVGASFGPICGAMAADFILSKFDWSGPRAGFNPAGWIAWALGFTVGAYDMIAAKAGLQSMTEISPHLEILALSPALSAIIVGFVVYLILGFLGVRTPQLELKQRID